MATSTMDRTELAHLVRVQHGVLARRQLAELGAGPHEIRRMLRRRDLTVVHPGVYVDHTGPLTDPQRAWAAVLYAWPAALADESALPGGPRSGPVHVAIADHRTVRPVPGVLVRRIGDFDVRVRWVTSPPQVRVEHAVIDVASRQPDVAARFRVLADACQTRQTSPRAILATLGTRRRVAHRSLLVDLLTDLDRGACSVLELEYLRLERVHGLPTADRQRAAVLGGRRVYRDVPYPDYDLVVELDGRAFHDSASARDRDLERDLDALVTSATLTVRLTYGQVFTHGCHTVARVAALLTSRGWAGTARPCGACGDVPRAAVPPGGSAAQAWVATG